MSMASHLGVVWERITGIILGTVIRLVVTHIHKHIHFSSRTWHRSPTALLVCRAPEAPT